MLKHTLDWPMKLEKRHATLPTSCLGRAHDHDAPSCRIQGWRLVNEGRCCTAWKGLNQPNELPPSLHLESIRPANLQPGPNTLSLALSGPSS